MRYTREQIEALSVQFFETRLKEVVPVIRTVDLLQTNGDLQGIFLITDFTITNTMPFPRFIIGDNSKRTFFAQAVSSESPDLNCCCYSDTLFIASHCVSGIPTAYSTYGILSFIGYELIF